MSRDPAAEALRRSQYGAYPLQLARQRSPAEECRLSRADPAGRIELRPQDILLPDHDVASLPVGEEAMEGSLDDITRRFERSVLTQLYRSYPSTRKLAKRLGVSHTAIANKLREYGLSQKKGDE
jgi:TyrR family helix-turn-helix protein